MQSAVSMFMSDGPHSQWPRARRQSPAPVRPPRLHSCRRWSSGAHSPVHHAPGNAGTHARKSRHECVQSLLIRISPGMCQTRIFRGTVDGHLNKGIGNGNVRQYSSVHMRLPESVELPTHTRALLLRTQSACDSRGRLMGTRLQVYHIGIKGNQTSSLYQIWIYL